MDVTAFVIAVLFLWGFAAKHDAKVLPRADYAPVVSELERLIVREMQDKKLPALSIALVDDQQTVWAKGFGMEDPDQKIPATAETVYRVGSVSKLFTDIGIMQLMEAELVEADAPITKYLPDFKPNNPFNKPITLRQLMSHRSGLVREPLAGHYFDDAFPDYGLYHGEKLIFTRTANGKATQVEAASVIFKRRHIDGEDGATFRITPLKSAEELRTLALAAQPPKENGEFLKSDLVELVTFDLTIKLDIRYASTNNFMSSIFYSQARAFLQRPAAEALVRAHQNLAHHGYGLLIHDGYRPWYVTKMFWDGTRQTNTISSPTPPTARATIAAARLIFRCMI